MYKAEIKPLEASNNIACDTKIFRNGKVVFDGTMTVTFAAELKEILEKQHDSQKIYPTPVSLAKDVPEQTVEELQEYKGIAIGDEVVLCKEKQGFDDGRPQDKTVQEIKKISRSARLAAQINMPRVEILWTFTDGTLAGCFDRVRKAMVDK